MEPAKFQPDGSIIQWHAVMTQDGGWSQAWVRESHPPIGDIRIELPIRL